MGLSIGRCSRNSLPYAMFDFEESQQSGTYNELYYKFGVLL